MISNEIKNICYEEDCSITEAKIILQERNK